MTTQLATHTLCRMSTRRQETSDNVFDKCAFTYDIFLNWGISTNYIDWVNEEENMFLIFVEAWERRKYRDLVGDGWRMYDGGVRQKQQKNKKKTNMLSIGVIYTFLVEKSSVNWVRTTTKSSSYLEWITLSFFWLQCWNFQLEINSQANDDAQL